MVVMAMMNDEHVMTVAGDDDDNNKNDDSEDKVAKITIGSSCVDDMRRTFTRQKKITVTPIEIPLLVQGATAATVRRLAISQMHVPNCT